MKRAAMALLMIGCTAAPAPTCSPACADGYTCVNGACVASGGGDAGAGDASTACSAACGGLTPFCNANGKCVGCLMDAQCPDGRYCKTVGDSASCVLGCSDDSRCGGGKCCNGQCADTSSDPANCGGCGKACAGAHAQATCAGGQCGAGACDPGWGDCNGNPADGCETNLHVDAKNCTACGMACNLAHAIQGCADGCYVSACQFGFDDCNGDLKDGCETPTLSDPNNCGGCGKSCKGLPNATASCTAGNCVLGACNAGFGNCDGDPANGCEANFNSDAKNCGGCGNVCPMNTPNCGGGMCSVMPVCVRVGWKTGSADWSCPQGYRMPTTLEWNSVAPCCTQQDNAMFGTMADVATVVGGCNCKWNNNWCGQPSIETIRQGRMCGDFQQLQICLK